MSWTETGERVIGDAAKNQGTIMPEETVFDVKRLIGRKFTDSTVQSDKKLLPFELVPKDGKPYIKVAVGDAVKTFASDLGDGPAEDALHRATSARP